MDIKDVFDDITERFSDLYRRIQQLEVAATIPTGGAIGGGGTVGLIPEWVGVQTLGDSKLSETIAGAFTVNFTGAITANRTINLPDGNLTFNDGFTFTSTLVDPLTVTFPITQSQTNVITTTSDAQTNPSTILAGDANGALRLARLGIGIAPSGLPGILHVYDSAASVDMRIETDGVNLNASVRLINDAQQWSIQNRGDLSDAFTITDETGGGNEVFLIETGAATDALRLDSNGTLFLNETTNTNMTIGITLDQAANDDEILNLRSSDVGAVYSGVETNTFGTILKTSGVSGGIKVEGYKDSDGAAGAAFLGRGWLAENADTTKSTAGRAIFEAWGYQTDGTNLVNTVANGNVFGVLTRRGGGTVALALIDEDADLVMVDGTISTTSGGTDAWQLHDYTGGTVTDTGYIEVTIDGTTYQILARLPP